MIQPAAAAVRLRRPLTRSFASASRPSGPTSQFYKTFTRPVAKVLVVAVFTYQLVYWGWAKLEADEFRRNTDDLEAKLVALDKASKEQQQQQQRQREPREEKPSPRQWWWQ